MNKEQTYNSLLEQVTKDLVILEDKPEETPTATLRALWFAACGQPKSAQAAELSDLPELGAEQLANLKELIGRRLKGEPLAHISSRQQFMGVELLAGPEALVPRKETEILGNAIVALLNDMAKDKNELTVIDVCTGAGNLAVAYAIHEPKVKVYAADLSTDAVAMAKRNVEHLNLASRVNVSESDLLKAFDSENFQGQVDIISCNPPYISSAKVEGMHQEISSYEPRLAFDGGPFGIAIIQRLIKEAPRYLREGGWLGFEVGLGQGAALMKRLNKDTNYSELKAITDSVGETRAILAKVQK